MRDTTKAIIRAALDGDSSIGAEERREWARALAEGIRAPAAEGAPQLEPIVRHKEMRDLCGLSPQEIRRVAERGALVRVYGRGTHRSMGYTRASVRAWLGTRAPA